MKYTDCAKNATKVLVQTAKTAAKIKLISLSSKRIMCAPPSPCSQFLALRKVLAPQ